VSRRGLNSMRFRRIGLACLGACCILFGEIPVGCYASQSSKENDKVVVTDPDKGRNIALRAGQVLESGWSRNQPLDISGHSTPILPKN
jgi:hypothetical protein